VATGERGENFSLFLGAGEVRVSLAYGPSGTGEAMNKKIRSSGGGDECSRVRVGEEFFRGATQDRQKLLIDVFIRHM
jgi:hypothetical protein